MSAVSTVRGRNGNTVRKRRHCRDAWDAKRRWAIRPWPPAHRLTQLALYRELCVNNAIPTSITARETRIRVISLKFCLNTEHYIFRIPWKWRNAGATLKIVWIFAQARLNLPRPSLQLIHSFLPTSQQSHSKEFRDNFRTFFFASFCLLDWSNITADERGVRLSTSFDRY